jgi:hypothetical protein
MDYIKSFIVPVDAGAVHVLKAWAREIDHQVVRRKRIIGNQLTSNAGEGGGWASIGKQESILL